MTLLMRASINGVIDEIRPDSAEIQQGIALRRSPVTTTERPSFLAVIKKSRNLRLVCFTFSLKQR